VLFIGLKHSITSFKQFKAKHLYIEPGTLCHHRASLAVRTRQTGTAREGLESKLLRDCKGTTRSQALIIRADMASIGAMDATVLVLECKCF